MTGGRSKSAEEIRFATGRSPLGPILVAASDKGVVAVMAGDDVRHFIAELEVRFAEAHLVRDDHECAEFVKSVAGFIENPAEGLDLPLDLRGTDFQKRVWKALLNIPFGKTASYADVARTIGSPKAMRAVGNALSLNPLAYAIPCHRVFHSDGSPAGGSYGASGRQQAMVDREAKALQAKAAKKRRAAS